MIVILEDDEEPPVVVAVTIFPGPSPFYMPYLFIPSPYWVPYTEQSPDDFVYFEGPINWHPGTSTIH
jgi:hypothetical protein